MKIILKGGTVVNATGTTERDVYIVDGLFSESFPDREADEILNISGLHVLPGFIDAHVHFRDFEETHKEDWTSASHAAFRGGVTTVLDMPNNLPTVTSVEALEAKRAHVKAHSKVNFGLFFGTTPDNLDEVRRAEEIVGIKIYTCTSTGNLLLENPAIWREVFKIAKEKDIPVVVHAENEHRIRERAAQFEFYPQIRDCECARIAVEEALKLQREIGNKLHFAHVSCARELELLRTRSDARITCEVAPHHLFFTEDDMKDAFLKMNPPLRSALDAAALWTALRDGTVTCIATDHAPHTIEEKSRPVMEAPAGVPGVEFLLPLMLNAVQEGYLELERIIELCSVGPARVFNLKGKGQILPGFDADFVVADLSEERTIDRSMVRSKCGWSPYEGRTLKGWPIWVGVKGHVENVK